MPHACEQIKLRKGTANGFAPQRTACRKPRSARLRVRGVRVFNHHAACQPQAGPVPAPRPLLPIGPMPVAQNPAGIHHR